MNMSAINGSAQSKRESRVYSYIRFSTPEQAKGRSEPRQKEVAAIYAKKRGYLYDPKLNMADRGLSGFKGDNLKFGAMGAFLARIKNGSVRPGDVLVVENIDRITRLSFFEAFDVIGGILRAGVEIHTTSPEMTYDLKSAQDGNIYGLIGQITLANGESEKKSQRIGDAWGKLKQGARDGTKKVITARGPKWLNLVNERFVEDPAAAATIQMIFEDCLVFGGSRLIKKLNTSGVWKPSEAGWRLSYVNKILRNRAVLGEYQPFTKRRGGKRVPDGEPIANYYPRIVTDEQFNAVQRKIQSNRGTGGQTNTARSLFQGLPICAYCGGPMHRSSKGPKPKGGIYLICDNANRQVRTTDNAPKCGGNTVHYDDFQEAVLNNCQKLRPEMVLPGESENRKLCQRLRTQIAGQQHQASRLKEKIKNTVKLLPDVGEELRFELIEQDKMMRSELALLTNELEARVIELTRAERNQESFGEWQEGLVALKKLIAPDDAIDVRLRLRAHLREFISAIEVFGKGFPIVATGKIERRAKSSMKPADLKSNPASLQWSEWRQANQRLRPGVEEFVEEIEAHFDEFGDLSLTRSKTFRDFIADVTRRRMSREGRFYRIHFSTGNYVDAVPVGSLASGLRLVDLRNKGWEVVGPNIALLWEEYRKKHEAAPSRKRIKR